ncbi:hypothetical protein ACFLWI_02995 [Chloroflexota bacterium]
MMDITGLMDLIVVLSIAPIFFSTWDAQFYIDPGTGSLIIQILIAGFVGGLFVIKMFWGKVKAFFKNLFSKAGRGNG